MFMAFMSVLIFISAPLLGGKLGRMAGIRLRYSAVIMLALVVQILISVAISGAPKVLLVPLHLVVHASRALLGGHAQCAAAM